MRRGWIFLVFALTAGNGCFDAQAFLRHPETVPATVQAAPPPPPVTPENVTEENAHVVSQALDEELNRAQMMTK